MNFQFEKKMFIFQAKVHAFQLSLKILQNRNAGSNITVVPQPTMLVYLGITFIIKMKHNCVMLVFTSN